MSSPGPGLELPWSVPARGANLPWRLDALRRVGLTNLLGMAGIVVAWFGADSDQRPDRQLMWVLLAMLALMLLSVANVSWFLVGRRSVGLRRRALLRPLAQQLQRPTVHARLDVRHALVAAAGMRRYHEVDCQLVAGKELTFASRQEHEGAGRTACGMCRP